MYFEEDDFPEMWQPEPQTEDYRYGSEWDDEDEERQMFREQFAFLVADDRGNDCQRLFETYSV